MVTGPACPTPSMLRVTWLAMTGDHEPREVATTNPEEWTVHTQRPQLGVGLRVDPLATESATAMKVTAAMACG